jgi:1,2-diacylglycerol 3-beta-galactosyltransferase
LQAKVLSEVWNPVIRGRIRRAWMEHSADLVVSVYPLLNRNLGKYLRKLRSNPVFTIMVTDLGTAHYLWFSRYADHYLIPTENVHRRAVEFGVPDRKMTITGLPVSPAFSARAPRESVRRELGLEPDLPVALLVGGADGMGGIEAFAGAINAARPEGQLVVIAGRNAHLRERLSSMRWHIPVRVIGFTDEMHRWMQAADLLLSKAGPSTISEALTVGLPILLTGYLPGQEEANLQFVVDSGAGVYQPDPEKAAGLVRSWFSREHGTLEQMAENARRVAHPDAARDAVELLYGLAASRSEPRAYRSYGYPFHAAR